MKQILFVILISMSLNSIHAQSGYQQLDSKSFYSLINSKPGSLLDVRTLSEYQNGHIKDAGQLNYYSFSFKGKLLLLPKDQPVYLYCNTGWRSERAAKILVKNGYKEVYNLQHGIMEWNLENLPTIVDPNAEKDEENAFSYDQFTQIINDQKAVLIDFYAPWCAPCRQMMPMIDSLKKEQSATIDIIKINADASKKLIKMLQIRSVPYFVIYQKGEIRFQHHGSITKEELLKQLDLLNE